MANVEKSEPVGPKDPYHLVYFIMYWLGIGTLMPWNFFLAVNGYWMYKFRETNVTATIEMGGDSPNEPKLSDLQMKWGPYLSMAAMIPNVTVLLLNAVFGHKFRIKPLLNTALGCIVVIFIFTNIMTQVDTDSWQEEFMALSLFSVVIFNIMVALLQGGLFGTIGRFPTEYMGALVQGQALGGIIATATNVIMLACGLDDVNAAFYDFMVAVIYLVTAIVAFFFVTRTKFYIHYAEGHLAETVEEEKKPDEDSQLLEEGQVKEGEQQATPVVPRRTNILSVGYKIWVWILAVFISFFGTLAVFPSITQLAFSTEYEENTRWSRVYFIPVGCFLVFNTGDYVGRLLASWIKWPGPNLRGSIVALLISIIRLAFIPLFMFCNVSPQNRVVTQVYFKSDAAYLSLMCLFSLTNGYMGNICMSFAPKMLTDPVEQGQAASLMVFFLVFGLAIGSAVSPLCVSLL